MSEEVRGTPTGKPLAQQLTSPSWRSETPRHLLPGDAPVRKSVICFLLVLAVSMIVDGYWLHVLTMAAVYAIAAIGMNMALGWAGLLTMAQASLMGVAAYCSTLVMTEWNWPFLVSVVVAVSLAAALSASTGLVGGRIKSHYFIIITLGIQLSITSVIVAEESVTGGSVGLPVPRATVLGLDLSDPRVLSTVAILSLALVFGLAEWIRRRPLGRALVAIGRSPIAASATGIPAARHYAAAMGLAGGCAGLAGVLFGQSVGYLGPENFSVHLSISLITMLVVGGIGSNTGVLFGVALLVIVDEFIIDWGSAGTLVYGAVLLLSAVFLPGGITGVARSLVSRSRWGKDVKSAGWAVLFGVPTRRRDTSPSAEPPAAARPPAPSPEGPER